MASPMKFLKTIRFDASDDQVFELAAAPDEWAVSGGFSFANLTSDDVKGKTRQAFANGFLALGSFGRSTFTSVAECKEDDLEEIERALVAHFIEEHGAPGEDAACRAARDETRFILDLCEEPLINTIFTVRRSFDERGEIKEEFRTIQAPDTLPKHSRIWSVVEDNE